jgi:4-hydroxy 2-oxovalerate aldolase
MVSGANSLPQKQVMEWVSKRYYSFNSIIRALNNQSQGKDDNIELSKLQSDLNSYKKALIVGGGPSPVDHSKAIEQFLIQHPEVLVIHASSKNALSFIKIPNDQFFCLVGNEGHRLESVFDDQKIIGKCILPPYPRKMGTYIPVTLQDKSFELDIVDFTNDYKDSHTSIALQLAKDLNIEEIYVTGYDAYTQNISLKEQELFAENQFLFSKFKQATGVDLISLTPSGYDELKMMSVYSFIR